MQLKDYVARSVHGWYLGKEEAQKLISFMMSDDEDGCSVPCGERKKRFSQYKDPITQGIWASADRKMSYLIKTEPRSIDVSYKALADSLSMTGMTLKELLAKVFDIDLQPNTEYERDLLHVLESVPEDDRRLIEFNNEISHMLSDYWFEEDLLASAPYQRFRDYRQRMVRWNERKPFDEKMMEVDPSYLYFRDITSTGMHKSIRTAALAGRYLDIPVRWYFGLDETGCAFTKKINADIALEQYVRLGQQGRSIYIKVFNRVFPDIGCIEEEKS